ncbi:hypothetical protein DFH07DRAFT_902879 [Mycena maculata]|uniref:Phosphatidic acid phosphatase type 2/haloperoxidase domain-containing protein n=1 Tax=Mycena maculata TaxID=230809 RepID=A0AAD7JGS1_9AGAR|nr:hypothetical protein DFH07DRAFT_902879 [Mycena maculata]
MPRFSHDAMRTDPGTASPFRVGTWIRLHGIDIITMTFMAAPFFFFCVFQARRQNLDDFLTTTLGLSKSIITAAVFQVSFLKWLIGGLRPHFLAACQPNIQPGEMPSGNGFASMMYDRSVCTGDTKTINDSSESFPSGHSTAAWAGMLYLALYLNAQLKVSGAHNPAYWNVVLMFAPLLGATLISGALTIDEFRDCAGAVIGICMALVAFRQTFAAVFDFRTTLLFHPSPFLPSQDSTPYFDYVPRPESTSMQLPFTREGGWGWGQEACIGAPGDATVLEVSGYSGGAGVGRTTRTIGVGAEPQ